VYKRQAPDWSVLASAAQILGAMGRFTEVIQSAARNAEPSEVTSYALNLARDVNSWVAKDRVLDQEPEVTAARLELVKGARQVIANALTLLGVGAPEEM